MEQQKENTETIVEKILEEEKNMERKKELYPELYNIPRKIKMPKVFEAHAVSCLLDLLYY